MMKQYVQATSVTIGVGLLFLLIAVLLGRDFWSTLPQATCLTHGSGCFCEVVHGGSIKQPINMLSSLIFVYVGVLGLLIMLPETRRWVFAVVLIMGILMELLFNWQSMRDSRRYLLGGVIVMAAACTVWLLDTNRIFCDPTSWLQGHALWHMLCAVSGWMLWRYYATAKPVVTVLPSKP